MPPRQGLLFYVKRLKARVGSEVQAGIVSSPRLLPLRLRQADAGQLSLEVWPLVESAIHHLLDSIADRLRSRYFAQRLEANHCGCRAPKAVAKSPRELSSAPNIAC